MRRRMAALLSIAGIAGLMATTAAAMPPLVVELGAAPSDALAAPADRGAVAVAAGGGDVTVVGAEPGAPRPAGVTVPAGGLGWEEGSVDDAVLAVDRGAVAAALPAAVFTFGALIAALGLSPYRRPVG